MAEMAGLALGVVSLLAGFKGAVDGYLLLSDIVNAFDDSSFLIVKLKIEQRRLEIWGDYYGFSDQDQCARLKTEPMHAQKLILWILMEVESASTDIEKLVQRYGLHPVELDTTVANDGYKQSYRSSPLITNLIRLRDEINEKRKKRKNVTWAIRDNAKFEKLLDRLEYLNDSLGTVLPRSDASVLALGLSSYILPGENDRNSLAVIGSSTQQLLASCASLREVQLSRVKPTDIPFGELSVLGSKPDPTSQRSSAQYSPKDKPEVNVFIEWKEVDSDLQDDQRQQVISRIESLCVLLISPKPSKFCLLPCLGLVEGKIDQQRFPGKKRFGLVFELDAEHEDLPTTLTDLFLAVNPTTKKVKMPPLGDRFRLAQALASALLLLHSSKWLHKSFRSENILFFRPKRQLDGETSILKPYISGFEYFRPDREGVPSLESPHDKAGATVDPYLHPEYSTKFTRLHDIYSLGIVLIEIAMWRPIQRYYDPGTTAEAFRKQLVDGTPSLLGGMMGEVYQTVVVRCLKGEFGVDGMGLELEKAFWSKAVRELEFCRA